MQQQLSPAAAAALRCAQAFFRVLEENPRPKSDPNYDYNEGAVLERAENAFRREMPSIDSWESLPIYLACVTRAMELRILNPAEASRYLYAAQVAANILRPPRPEKAPRPNTTPLPLTDHDDSNPEDEELPDEFTQTKLFTELMIRKFPLPPERILRSRRHLAIYLCQVARFLKEKLPQPGTTTPPPPTANPAPANLRPKKPPPDSKAAPRAQKSRQKPQQQRPNRGALRPPPHTRTRSLPPQSLSP